MNTVQLAYLDALDSWSTHDKVHRGFRLTVSALNVVAHQIRKERPTIDEAELRLRVAERIYQNDPILLGVIRSELERKACTK